MSRKQRKKAKRKAERAADRSERRGRRAPLARAPYPGTVPLEQIDEVRWRVPKIRPMHTEGIVYSDESLLPDLEADRSLAQVANVATLPGIVGPSLAMPDIHWGYGFPIGGVAAFDPDEGVVSPGGVGYDINCGVRLLTSDAGLGDVKPRVQALAEALFEAVPAGVGSSREEVRLKGTDLDEILEGGLKWTLKKGYATPADRERVEELGCLEGAKADAVSHRAKRRGSGQLGTLGSGNHFAEVGVIDEIYDAEAAAAYGLREGGVTLMIHSGSRGLGHQVCTDHLQTMMRAAQEHDIPLVDRQLCCAPVKSSAGQRYLAAMAGAANFAFANRQLMTHSARGVFDRILGAKLETVYDVCHNIAKMEEHEVDGERRSLLVHRKGATRALPKGHALLPKLYADHGQPVIIPGDMGRYSFVLKGTEGSADTFGSACHGAGRVLSRSEAKRRFAHSHVKEALKARGVVVIGASKSTVVEEVPEAYKDVAEVVGVVDAGGLASRVARIRPLACVKG